MIPAVTTFNYHSSMITSKAYMIKIMKECEGADTLTREEKFQVFCNVCDNMLNDGRMTKATHKRFTEIWWHQQLIPNGLLKLVTNHMTGTTTPSKTKDLMTLNSWEIIGGTPLSLTKW